MNRVLGVFAVTTILTATAILAQDAGLRREEVENYYHRWLNEDVLYIISPEERTVFQQLQTDEEREQFIEQFWFRRDPDPRTAGNEFKEEHYRRIAYANDRFASGFPGWRTDRGRIYITHGPPAEIESYPSGGFYNRKPEEGGGQTSTFPFEVWRYREIQGLGSDIILEFVDRTHSGEYRLALSPDEKDALLFIPGAGLTLSEEQGFSDKRDRAFFNPANPNEPFKSRYASNNPFIRYETLMMVQRPVPLKYSDLKQVVEVDVRFSELPFQTEPSYFRLGGDQVLVPITVQISNRDLTFESVPDGSGVARVAVYGIVTSLQGQVINEFDQDMAVMFPMQELAAGRERHSVYQKLLILRQRQRYKLDLVIKDLNGNRVGVSRLALTVPAGAEREQLQASSLLFVDSVRQIPDTASQDEMFVIGDLKVIPNLGRTFAADRGLGLYFHLYNAALDQTTLSPQLRTTYRLFREGAPVRQIQDFNSESVQYFASDRVVMVRQLTLQDLPPGPYELRVEVEDLVTGRRLELAERLEVRED